MDADSGGATAASSQWEQRGRVKIKAVRDCSVHGEERREVAS
jgi:hypothetical protein